VRNSKFRFHAARDSRDDCCPGTRPGCRGEQDGHDARVGYETGVKQARLNDALSIQQGCLSEGLYIRLVLDIEESVYWVEATTDPFMLSTGDEDTGSLKGGSKETKEGEEGEGAEDETMDDGEPYAIKPAKPVFNPVDSYLLKPTKLPDSVHFKDVYVEHDRSSIDSGKAEVYFFPNGMVEHAVINLRDEGDEINYSLETNPISGRVNIEARYRTREE